MQERRVAPRPP